MYVFLQQCLDLSGLQSGFPGGICGVSDLQRSIKKQWQTHSRLPLLCIAKNLFVFAEGPVHTVGNILVMIDFKVKSQKTVIFNHLGAIRLILKGEYAIFVLSYRIEGCIWNIPIKRPEPTTG